MSKNIKKKSSTIENRKAYHDYYVEEQIQCGIELRGNEVKSIREGKASIKESWASIDNGEVFVKQMHITAWGTANKFDVDENRNRKLLLHKKEIKDLEKKIQRDGYTLVPLKVYFDDRGKCKVLLGLCKGKHSYDKRNSEKEKQTQRDIDRVLRGK